MFIPPLPDSPMDDDTVPSGSGSNGGNNDNDDTQINDNLDSLIAEGQRIIGNNPLASGLRAAASFILPVEEEEKVDEHDRKDPKSRSVMAEKAKNERKEKKAAADKAARQRFVDEKRRASSQI